MRRSYINRDYSRKILKVWEQQGYMHEVQRRLGYRFTLLKGTFDRQSAPGDEFFIDISLANNRFAPPYNPRGQLLLLRNTNDSAKLLSIDMPDDPRFWLGGDTLQLYYHAGLPNDIPEGIYDVLLHYPDPMERLFGHPDYSIRLANSDTWGSETGYNRHHNHFRMSKSTDATSFSGGMIFSTGL